jgi:hypothetical protein
MTILTYLGRIMALTLVILLAGTSRMAGYDRPGLVAETSPTPSSSASGRWFLETIESTPTVHVGQHVSVAIDRYSGATSISHYDATNQNLRHARSVGSGGNCGEHNNWNCWLRDGGSVTNVGQYSSLALEPRIQQSIYDWPKFAYYNATLGALEYTARDWPGQWHYTTVDDYETGPIAIGQYASLALDSDRKPHIAYHLDSPLFLGSGSLKYATHVGSGWGNCGGDDHDWQCDTIDHGNQRVGEHASLWLSASGNPSIAYYNSGDLKFTTKGGSVPNCGPGGNTWTCWTVDSVGDVGQYASFVRDQSSGIPHIAYYDATNEALKVAHLVLSGGNCGPYNSWQCDEIDHMGTSPTHMGVSLALDSNGRPVIAYQQTSEIGPAVLKVARPAAALGLPYGNCGPETPFLTWQCETVDKGSGHTDAGAYVDLTLNDAGLVVIAYYESDSYHLSGNLKIARQAVASYLPLALRNAP